MLLGAVVHVAITGDTVLSLHRMMPSTPTVFVAHLEMPSSLVVLHGSRAHKFPEAKVRSRLPRNSPFQSRDTHHLQNDTRVLDSMLKPWDYCLLIKIQGQRMRGERMHTSTKLRLDGDLILLPALFDHALLFYSINVSVAAQFVRASSLLPEFRRCFQHMSPI